MSLRFNQRSSSGSRVLLRNSPVQRLFELCIDTFSVPSRDYSPEAVESLRSFLDTITAADVGLREIETVQHTEGLRPLDDGDKGVTVRETRNVRGRHVRGRSGRVRRPGVRAGSAPTMTTYVDKPAISYMHVFECDSFSIGIFCLPATAVLPLHNHPDMTVLSKLLYGSLHLKSYDLVSDYPSDIQVNSAPPNSKLARKKADAVYTAPCEPTILSPTQGGTIHSLTAVSACAILDVLAPPYSENEGRHCTYYRVSPCVRVNENGSTETEDIPEYSWLEETEMPEDLLIIGPKAESR